VALVAAQSIFLAKRTSRDRHCYLREGVKFLVSE
jgi:hypothetical protein